jgi:hypothetical protein
MFRHTFLSISGPGGGGKYDSVKSAKIDGVSLQLPLSGLLAIGGCES